MTAQTLADALALLGVRPLRPRTCQRTSINESQLLPGADVHSSRFSDLPTTLPVRLRARLFSAIVPSAINERKSTQAVKRWVLELNGVDDGARTHDNRNHNPGLYQLSYIHHCVASKADNGKTGLPDRNRTCNPQLRRLVLYPVELRAETHFSGNKWGGRGEGIRTPDILLPKQARYRAALHPEILFMPTSCISEKRDYTWAEWVWSIFA
jgi:hypothetical protein